MTCTSHQNRAQNLQTARFTMPPSITKTEDRTEWRARIQRALAELQTDVTRLHRPDLTNGETERDGSTEHVD
jgi:hypothetical protein